MCTSALSDTIYLLIKIAFQKAALPVGSEVDTTFLILKNTIFLFNFLIALEIVTWHMNLFKHNLVFYKNIRRAWIYYSNLALLTALHF